MGRQGSEGGRGVPNQNQDRERIPPQVLARGLPQGLEAQESAEVHCDNANCSGPIGPP